MPCIAKVAVNDATIHFDKLYSYLVPPDFSESLWPGSIVLVPFGRGNHPRMAVVLEVGTEEAPDPRLKSLLAAAPEKARLTPDLLELVQFFERPLFLYLVRGGQGGHSVWRAVPARHGKRKARIKKPPNPHAGNRLHSGWRAAGETKTRRTPDSGRGSAVRRALHQIRFGSAGDIFLHFKRVMPERHSESRTTG